MPALKGIVIPDAERLQEVPALFRRELSWPHDGAELTRESLLWHDGAMFGRGSLPRRNRCGLELILSAEVVMCAR